MVLVHGLWGNPSQFDYIVNQLISLQNACLYNESKVPASNFIIYRATSFPSYKTYDGIDVNGHRVAKEVIDVIENLQNHDKVDTIDMVGYSLGGLVSRFALGVLYQSGVFDKIQPRLFTTFCSPHVGVVVLGNKLSTRIFNTIGSLSMARTSRQLFLRDKINKNEQPLLLCMTEGVFTEALQLFKIRILYANVAYDMRCEWYTAGISLTDPYVGRPELLRGPYINGYEPTILDSNSPPEFETLEKKEKQNISILAFLRIFLLPLWFVGFVINSTFQNITSALRQNQFRKSIITDNNNNNNNNNNYYNLDLHLAGEELVDQGYDVVEDLYRAMNENKSLALNPIQYQIITKLNQLEFKKFPVLITKHTHAHAAVIVRYKHKKFTEGELIISHWINQIKELS